jgi:amino acid adenylation domain-containing protein
VKAASGIDEIEDIYELTGILQGMLFHSIYEPHSSVYVEQAVCAIRGDIDGELLREAFRIVVQRYPALRTSFHWQGFKKPLQVVMKHVDVPWKTADWRRFRGAEQRQRMMTWLDEDRKRAFQLDQAPIFRCTLVRLASESYRLLWTFHHLLIDGWSLSIVFSQLFAVYEALLTGQPLPLAVSPPFRNYVLWRQSHTNADAPAFWRRYLAGIGGPTRVTSGTMMNSLRGRHQEVSHTLSEELTGRLREFARRHRVTMNTVVVGAVAFVLARRSGQSDVMFGSTVSGRPAELEGSEDMVGLFINTLPLRAQVVADMDLGLWLQRLQADQLERDRFSQDSLVDIHGWSDVPRGVPLFEMLLVFENYPRPDQWGSKHTKVTGVRVLEQTNYPLTLIVAPEENLRLRVAWYDASCETTYEQGLMRHLIQVLAAVGLPARRRVGDLPRLASADRRRLDAWSAGEAVVGWPEGIEARMSACAARHPDREAVVFGAERLTYRDLEERANGLAWRLRVLGVGPETCVGIGLERTPALLVAVLGVLKAGGAYVPIDRGYPPERVRSMVADAGIRLMLCEPGERDWLAEDGVQGVMVGTERASSAPENVAAPENLAYVIYTSGSTGRPKGCGVSRGAFGNLVAWYAANLDGAPVRAMILSSFGFDLTQKNLWVPLMLGGSVHLPVVPYFDGRAICAQIAADEITVVNCTPSAFYPVLEAAEAGAYGALTTLRHVVLGGEPIARGRLSGWLRSGGCRARVMNSYGPTECADVSASHWIDPDEDDDRAVPIGGPIDGTGLAVLDEGLHAVPSGVAGELFITGTSIGRGYVGDPRTTAERFVPNPYSTHGGERLYRTGDRARFTEDGTIELMGRFDRQIKIRGFRIEPAELENLLEEHPNVRRAHVVVRQASGNSQLRAYVILEQVHGDYATELRAFVRMRVPEYMVPSAFIPIDRSPLTANGKVDYTALLAMPPPIESEAEPFVPPRIGIEHTVAREWCRVLGIHEIGRNMNFFDAGGDSLLLLQVHSRLEKSLERQIALVELFDHPTIAAMSGYLDQRGAEAATQGDIDEASPATRSRRAQRHEALAQRALRRRGGEEA